LRLQRTEDRMDEAENVQWLRTHSEADEGWDEHYDVLVSSVAREKGIAKNDARKYADEELQRRGVPVPGGDSPRPP
jgi:hypothetical protein